MFTLSLKGRFGLIVAARLHLLVLALTLLMFNVGGGILKIGIFAIFVAASLALLVHMEQNRSKLVFNNPVNRNYAYPPNAKVERFMALFQTSLVTIFFLPTLWLLVSEYPIPEDIVWAFALFFYLTALSFLDILHRVIRRRFEV